VGDFLLKLTIDGNYVVFDDYGAIKTLHFETILKNQAIIDDIRKCTKSDIQNGKKTITLARLETLVRGVDE